MKADLSILQAPSQLSFDLHQTVQPEKHARLHVCAVKELSY